MQDHYQFTPDMKKILVLSMLVSLTMICSCQKKESAAQQELAQRKVELDAREEELAERKSALDERLNSLDEKVNSLDERVKELDEKITMNAPTNPTDVQGQTLDPAQVQAERDSIVQQSSTMLSNHSQLVDKLQKEMAIGGAEELPGMGELHDQKQREEIMREKQRKL
jgi:uncharacterized protein YlxW (UPF0749 family)